MTEELHSALRVANTTWGLTPTKTAGCHLMWKLGKLHSVACVGFSETRSVDVPVVTWCMLRMIGERMLVPSSVYVAGAKDDEAWFCSWPVQSGMKYPVVMDEKFGGLIKIPKSEFKRVETKK